MMVFQQVSQRPSIVLTIGDDDGAGEEDDDEDGLHDATDKEEAVGWLVVYLITTATSLYNHHKPSHTPHQLTTQIHNHTIS